MTFGELCDDFYAKLDAHCKQWGVETPRWERPLVEAALAGMLNDGTIRVSLYEVHDDEAA